MSKTETTKKFTIPQEIADKLGIPATIEVKVEEEHLNPMATAKKNGYTKTCNGCNGQIVMRNINDKWGAYENYDTDDYHNCNKSEPKLTI